MKSPRTEANVNLSSDCMHCSKGAGFIQLPRCKCGAGNISSWLKSYARKKICYNLVHREYVKTIIRVASNSYKESFLL